MSSIIVYFSRAGENMANGEIKIFNKGNTEILAEKIQKAVSGDIFQILPEENYPFAYDACKARSKKEHENNDLPLISNLKEHLLDAYDTIYIGFPIWSRSFPRIISTFLQCYDLNGKIIKPFCTNEEGDFGYGELELRSLLKDSGCILKPGLSIRGYEVSKSDNVVKEWVNK